MFRPKTDGSVKMNGRLYVGVILLLLAFWISFQLLMIFSLHWKESPATPSYESHKKVDETKDSISDGFVRQEDTMKSGIISDPANEEIHIVFSTDCRSSVMEVSSLMLQHSAVAVGHLGPMTRIVSGCTASQQAKLQRDPKLHPNYHLHFTPAYSPHPTPNVTDDFAPYNKPFGLRHWLQHYTDENNFYNTSIVALVDADFIFLRRLYPIENTTLSPIRYSGFRPWNQIETIVKPGQALAQDWFNYMGFGMWKGKRRIVQQKLCRKKPCGNVPLSDAKEYYAPTGPPYIMHLQDMKAFVDDYCEMTIGIRKEYKEWMSEMYAFAVAASNHRIRFTVLADLGVTHPQYAKNDREYWAFADQLTHNPCAVSHTSRYGLREGMANEAQAVAALPVALHLCLFYTYIEYQGKTHRFDKQELPSDLMQCQTPLLAIPPEALWDLANAHAQRSRKRAELWTHCVATRQINAALMAYKEKACLDSPDGWYNLNQSLLMVTELGAKQPM